MDLKNKFESAKKKFKAHAPELIAITSTAIIGTVIVYLNRQTPTNYDPDYVAYNHESNGVDGGEGKPEGMIHHQKITAEEMGKLLDDGTMTAYTVDDDDVTFYTIS